MRFGVRAHDYGKHSPKELAAIISKDGFQAVQLAIPKAIAGIDNTNQITKHLLEEIRNNFEQQAIQIAVLGCYIEPALLDSEKRKEQIELFCKSLEYSKVLKADLVGTETTAFVHEESERSKIFEILTDSVLRITEKAEKIGARVGIEPVVTHTLNTPELTYQLMQRVKSDKVKIIFDPVNLLNPHNVADQEALWKECIEAFGNDIEVMHIKDVIAMNNTFHPTVLGEGHINYEYLFEWVQKNKPHISLLREELQPLTAHKDLKFLTEKIRLRG